MTGNQAILTDVEVRAALDAAVETARALGVKMAVAVMDAGGNLAGFVRMPGSFLASIDYAQWKAWTAASFGMASRDLGEIIDRGGSHIRDGLNAHPKVTSLPGGFPILREGVLIGAIGASGGSGEEDEKCALAGAEAALR